MTTDDGRTIEVAASLQDRSKLLAPFNVDLDDAIGSDAPPADGERFTVANPAPRRNRRHARPMCSGWSPIGAAGAGFASTARP